MIGAHNTLSYFPPAKWWMKPFAFVFKCQNKSLSKLIAEGCTFFDIRVSYDRDDQMIASHGLARFNASIPMVIYFISQYAKSRPVVRLILENGNARQREYFKKQCALLEAAFDNVKFIGGNYRKTWERLYEFSGDDIRDNIVQYVGSMQSWWGKLCPWLYARIYNRRNLREAAANPDKYYLFDFL